MLTPSPTLQQNMATASPWFILTSKVAVGVGVGWRGGSTERDRRTNKQMWRRKKDRQIFLILNAQSTMTVILGRLWQTERGTKGKACSNGAVSQ